MVSLRCILQTLRQPLKQNGCKTTKMIKSIIKNAQPKKAGRKNIKQETDGTNRKQNVNMADLNPTISITPFYVHGLNFPSKRQRQASLAAQW